MSMSKGAVPLGFATLLLAASAGLIAWVATTALIQLVHWVGLDSLPELAIEHRLDVGRGHRRCLVSGALVG